MTTHERPTRSERASSEGHDHRSCAQCCDPNLHGDQALDPLEVENDQLKAEVARLTRDRDAWRLAVDIERELCAQLAEAERIEQGPPQYNSACDDIAAAIRARGGA